MYQINIVFPSFNPPETWENEFISYCKQLQSELATYHFRFILVNDGSRKGFEAGVVSKLQAELPNVLILHHPVNQGKGQAVRTGVEHCENGMIIYCDRDFPFGTKPFQNLIQQLEQGVEVVFGNRDHSYHDKLPLFRRLISIFFQFINRPLIPADLSGCQAGMLGFQEQAKPLFLQTTINRFLFATEFARIIYKKRLKYSTIPLTLRDIDPHTTINKKSMLQELSNLFYLLTRIPVFKY